MWETATQLRRAYNIAYCAVGDDVLGVPENRSAIFIRARGAKMWETATQLRQGRALTSENCFAIFCDTYGALPKFSQKSRGVRP